MAEEKYIIRKEDGKEVVYEVKGWVETKIGDLKEGNFGEKYTTNIMGSQVSVSPNGFGKMEGNIDGVKGNFEKNLFPKSDGDYTFKPNPASDESSESSGFSNVPNFSGSTYEGSHDTYSNARDIKKYDYFMNIALGIMAGIGLFIGSVVYFINNRMNPEIIQQPFEYVRVIPGNYSEFTSSLKNHLSKKDLKNPIISLDICYLDPRNNGVETLSKEQYPILYSKLDINKDGKVTLAEIVKQDSIIREKFAYYPSKSINEIIDGF